MRACTSSAASNANFARARHAWISASGGACRCHASGSPEPEPEQSSPWAEKVHAKEVPAEEVNVIDQHAEAVVHIPCPNGHQLETPREILGEDAMCPICQAQFHLRLEDSIEYRRHRAEQFEQRERQIGNQWMNAAIIAAMVVLGAVICLIAAAVSR